MSENNKLETENNVDVELKRELDINKNNKEDEKEDNQNEFLKKVGNYLLFEQIGMGSFSKVTKAIHLITEQTVAVKILEKEKIEDEIDIERIIREIEILKTIMHPNIAQMYESYSTIHNIYLMMEYVEGGDLFDYITKNTFLPEQKACHFYRQIISVLEYLSEMGITHRDIKPENILLDQNHNNIKFIDFGLSNYCKDKELLQSSCGSPCYASPEMLSGNPYKGCTTDLWSSGIVLYSMLVGSLPFDDQEIQKLYAQIKAGKFYIPSTLSLEAIDLLKRILEVNPSKRITIKQIKEHPWFNFVQNPMYKGIFYKNGNKIPYNNKVISYVINNYYKDDENINNDKLIEMIEKHESNQYTATYYIVKKYILKINYDEKENNDKFILKLKNNNNKVNTNNEEDNMNINQKQNSQNKISLVSNMNKDKIREDSLNNKKEILQLDLKNINFISINKNNNKNNKPYTNRGISPPNELKDIYDFNNNNNNFVKYKTDENINDSKNIDKNNIKEKNNNRKDTLYLNHYNCCNKGNTTKNNETIPYLSKTDENILLDKEKCKKDKNQNDPFIKDTLKTECNITQEKKMNDHRIKYFNIIPKLNISNINVSNNYKKKYINFMNCIDNKDNFINMNNNNGVINNSKTNNKNYSLYCYNKNKNNNNTNVNKNYIFSYLNKDYNNIKEKIHKRNSSTTIKNHIQNSKTVGHNRILFATKLGLLSKVKHDNNMIMLNINNNLSRNENSEISKTKRLELTKSLDKNNYLISPRTLEQKRNHSIRTNNIIREQYKGIHLIEIGKNKKWNNNKNNINLYQNDINLKNINNNIRNNSNNNNNNNNKYINKYYFNNGNIINNNNNIILNIQNYYNRKNKKTYTYNNKKAQNKY